jgi:Carbohydrate binding domain
MRSLSRGAIVGLVLTACGGGGGGAGDGSWLTFAPSSISATSYTGEPALTITVVATSSKTISEPLQAGLVFDRADVFDAGSTLISAVNSMQYSARFHTQAALATGVYSGTLEVRLCRDAPITCSDPYPGSPWHVPYQVTVAAPSGAAPVVSNGDFSNGTIGWRTWAMNGGAVSLTAGGGVLNVTLGTPGGVSTDVQVIYDGPSLDLVGGKTYVLHYDASATFARSMDVSIWENGRDLSGDGFAWSTYSYTTVALGTAMQTYTAQFTMPYTNAAAGLVFFVGGSTGGVHIDNVSITELP